MLRLVLSIWLENARIRWLKVLTPGRLHLHKWFIAAMRARAAVDSGFAVGFAVHIAVVDELDLECWSGHGCDEY